MAAVPPSSDSTAPGAPTSILSRVPLALHFVHPAELRGLIVPLTHGLELGRAAAEELPAEPRATLAHATVSRRHAAIHYAFADWTITDLQSANGTRVDGIDLETAAVLKPQSVVRLGDVLAVVDEHRAARQDHVTTLWGTSPRVVRLRDLVQRAAVEPVPVLIQGETGTGKEFLAADVHRLSGRDGQFVKLNSAELSPQLIESQLFGHERGAFTGATVAHQGLFVAADRGTLFLDEIGELGLDLQAKLLRVIQEGEVRPVGSVKTRKVDVRVVCATNRALAEEAEAGRFRRDLYARLSFFELVLPPLRERRQDILGWIERLSERWAADRGRTASINLQPSVAERLLLHPWPENLRGLDRFTHRVLSKAPEANVGLRALFEALPEVLHEPIEASPSPEASEPLPPEPTPAEEPATPMAARRPSREEFLAVYEATGRSVRATSKYFGRDRRQIYRWLETFGIERQ